MDWANLVSPTLAIAVGVVAAYLQAPLLVEAPQVLRRAEDKGGWVAFGILTLLAPLLAFLVAMAVLTPWYLVMRVFPGSEDAITWAFLGNLLALPIWATLQAQLDLQRVVARDLAAHLFVKQASKDIAEDYARLRRETPASSEDAQSADSVE